MKFTKFLFTVSLSMCLLFGLLPYALSRAKVLGQGSGTSEEPSSVVPTSRDKALKGMIVLYGTHENANTSVPAPPLLKRSERSNAFRMAHSQFQVTYTGFTDEARAAFQYAVDVWASLIRSPVPIRIDATFTDFGGHTDRGIILGAARPAGWKSGGLDLWFVDALADMRAGRDLGYAEPDIITKFNSHEDTNWYFGTDGNPPAGKMDFVSTVMHEIAHGLGFFSAAREEDTFRTFSSFSPSSGMQGKLRSGRPELAHIYDFFVVNGSRTAITTFSDPSIRLLDQFTSNDLFWSGEKGVEANGGELPQLYAPSAWSEGSGYSHLDETRFPAGDANALMTPYLASQEAVHDPGPITLGMFKDMGWTINEAPVFTEGHRTTRTVAADVGRNVGIGEPITATDPNGDPLLYSLSGTDADAFDIDSTSGQLKTKVALHGKTKASYTVTVTVFDGSLIDKITIIITVIKVVVVVPTNRAPNFIEGSHATRTVAENTPRRRNIGKPITATDTDNDALTYTLGGLDAAAFDINAATGQLETRAALDYETKSAYTVRVTVSDGSLTDVITVTITIIDVDDQKSPMLTLTAQPLTEATLNESSVTLRLSHRVYENWLNDPVRVSGIAGVTLKPFNVERVSDTELSVKLTFDGTDFDTDATLTFTLKPDAIANYNGPALTATARVTAVAESLRAVSTVPLTEAILNGSSVTLTLSRRHFESRHTVGNNVSVSGIIGVTVRGFDVQRLSDTQVTLQLIFDGTDFDTDATLIFKVGSGAVTEYKGAQLIARLRISAVREAAPVVTAFTPRPLTEATLKGSSVTLTLSSGAYQQSTTDIHRAVQVSGIRGVTVRPSDVTRLSGTKVIIKLAFDNTNFDTDATLTFSVGSGALLAYNGPALIARIRVTTVVEGNPTLTLFTPQPITEATLDGSVVRLTLNNAAYVPSRAGIQNAVTVSGIAGVGVKKFGVDRLSDTEIAVALEFDGNFDTAATLTVTVRADAIAKYRGPALSVQVLVTGGQESVVATTETPLTEVTLNGSLVTLTLNGATYERSIYDLRDAVSVSGIDGVTVHWFDLDRISDTVLTLELTFSGNVDTDVILTFTVGADAIAGYRGPALRAQLRVTASTEAITASSASPLTEATLDRSVVTLTLTGAKYARSISDIRAAVSVSGIAGVTVDTFGIDRISDTELRVELAFNGDIALGGVLTFRVGTGALLRYSGAALTANIAVTAVTESVIASTASPLTEATLDKGVVTLTLTDAEYVRSSKDIQNAVSVSGIKGLTVSRFGINRISHTEIRLELEFDGNIDTDSTLTFTVGAGALWNYTGPALTTQISVTAVTESVIATTTAPLTEGTLDGSVVTLTLTGAEYARSLNAIRAAVSVSGIDGVRIEPFDIDRHNNTKITVELTFAGDIDTDSTLTFTVGAGGLWNYQGPALTAEVPVTAIRENFLLANFPNPFNPETWIPYQLSKPTAVTITIYAANGHVVRTLALGHQGAGLYQSRSRAAYWDGRNSVGEPAASGVYFYTLSTESTRDSVTADNFTATRKMLIRK